MKLQEVILKAMAGKLTWIAAAEIIGVTDRTMRRWRNRRQKHCDSGLWDCWKKCPSPNECRSINCNRCCNYTGNWYFDFNVCTFTRSLSKPTILIQLHMGEDSLARGGAGEEVKKLVSI